MNQDEVIALMKSSKSEKEWNHNCEEVKLRCDGYPEFWHSAVIMSGVFAETMAGIRSESENIS